MNSTPAGRLPLVWLGCLFLITLVWRGVAPHEPALLNSVPLAAMCFGGAFLCGRHWWWLPACLLLATDAVLTAFAGFTPSAFTLVTAALFLAAAWLGQHWSRGQSPLRGWGLMIGGSLVVCVLHYLAGNTYAWAVLPEYEKSFAGWWRSQTVGLPGPYPPAIAFLRNALVGNACWCLLAAPFFFSRNLAGLHPRRAAAA